MKTAAAFVVGVILGAGAWAVLSGDRLGGGVTPSPPAMCEATVKLSLEPDGTSDIPKIVADPAHAICLARTRPLTWDIRGAGEVTIRFDEKDVPGLGKVRGPFPHKPGNNPYNTGTGLYVRPSAVNDKLNSNAAEDKPEYEGDWKYTVYWKLGGAADKDPQPLDPVVCIRR